MNRAVLIDTNLLIKAFDNSDANSEAQLAASNKLADLLSDESVDIAITPLIRYEFLRHVEFYDRERYKMLADSINDIFLLQISVEVSELATKLYQFDTFEAAETNKNKKVDKRRFDAFHLAAAKCNGYEIASDDSDIAKLGSLYERLQEALSQADQENTNPEENA